MDKLWKQLLLATALCMATSATFVTQTLPAGPDLPDINVQQRAPNHHVAVNVKDKYIVTLKPDVNVQDHLDFVQQLHTSTALADGENFKGITHQYNISTFQGYAAHLPSSIISQLQSHPDIATIDPDTIWHLDRIIEQPRAPYGLGLISHRNPTLQNANQYVYDSSAGTGTTAYIVDSGINIEHPEFQGRADLGYNALDPRRRGVWGDTQGHGTHTAGIIGSRTFGVAKQCHMVAVKVVENDDANLSVILDGFQWAVRQITPSSSRGPRMSVIHVSVYGPVTRAWNRAVLAAAGEDVVIVQPAGNENRDVRDRYSGLHGDAIIVSATDERRRRAPWANYGMVVDWFAPGERIQSTVGHGQTQVRSGSAQAAAFVSGLVLYFKAMGRVGDVEETKQVLTRHGIARVVQTPAGGPKGFVYNGCGR